jgi:DNA-binding transcriptional regulator GbsR (MarR family)
MTTLPASIESYLLEAGFSATEVLVLKRLLEGEAMTLRELAAKTGKSTGVLDQATKKLSDKNIVVKESINGSPKCTLSSLDAIRQWMDKDMNQKKDVLHRKKQDFDAFIATVEHEKDRPEMQYFEGLKGLEQAFTKLLDMKSAEWLHFVPALMREEDDPLCEFRVNLFRERRRNKVFMRSIGQDVPLGRRYQSRDVFEYRDSRLVAVNQFPVSFEEFIVGDTIACFDIPNQKASFINYPAMADSQRHMFEMLWCQAECGDTEECAASVENRPPQEPDMETRVLSGLREFFMSKKGLGALAVSALVALIITFGMYQYTLNLMKEEIGQRLISIVATAAPEISYLDLEAVHTEEDMKKPQYQNLFNKLNEIRDSNRDILYSYIMRPTSDPELFEFVADADSNFFLPENPDDPEAIEVLPPGTSYDANQLAHYDDMETLLSEAISDAKFTTDKWGTYLSASAPIFDQSGIGIAIIGVDMDVSDVHEEVNNRFKPYIWFLIFFAGIILIRISLLLK